MCLNGTQQRRVVARQQTEVESGAAFIRGLLSVAMYRIQLCLLFLVPIRTKTQVPWSNVYSVLQSGYEFRGTQAK